MGELQWNNQEIEFKWDRNFPAAKTSPPPYPTLSAGHPAPHNSCLTHYLNGRVSSSSSLLLSSLELSDTQVHEP